MAATMRATPGYNVRLSIFFEVDRGGRRLAYRWSGRQLRAFRMGLDEADTLIATEQADRLDGHPLRPASR
jgi:hypothetical protein